MKKITLLAAAFVAITFASCRKDKTCTCTDTSGGVTVVTKTTAKSNKKDAAAWCDAGQKSTTTVNGTPYTGGASTATCKVD